MFPISLLNACAHTPTIDLIHCLGIFTRKLHFLNLGNHTRMQDLVLVKKKITVLSPRNAIFTFPQSPDNLCNSIATL